MLFVRQMRDMTEQQLDMLRRKIIERVTSVFTSRPTWSAMPFVDHGTYSSIEQAINDEFDKHQKLHVSDDVHTIES